MRDLLAFAKLRALALELGLNNQNEPAEHSELESWMRRPIARLDDRTAMDLLLSSSASDRELLVQLLAEFKANAEFHRKPPAH